MYFVYCSSSAIDDLGSSSASRHPLRAQVDCWCGSSMMSLLTRELLVTIRSSWSRLSVCTEVCDDLSLPLLCSLLITDLTFPWWTDYIHGQSTVSWIIIAAGKTNFRCAIPCAFRVSSVDMYTPRWTRCGVLLLSCRLTHDVAMHIILTCCFDEHSLPAKAAIWYIEQVWTKKRALNVSWLSTLTPSSIQRRLIGKPLNICTSPQDAHHDSVGLTSWGWLMLLVLLLFTVVQWSHDSEVL